MKSHLINLTRGNEIGANSYLLNLGGSRVVLDAGMHPQKTGWEATANFSPLAQQPPAAIFLTHAHHDHTGSLPLLMQRHPDARVFMSEPTYFLAEPLLHNSVNVMKRQREELSIREYPLFTHNDLQSLTKKWQACQLNRHWSIEGFPIKPNDAFTCRFRLLHAGHILGSTMVELETAQKRVLYTGDICLHDQTLMTRAARPEGPYDLLIIETTRGAQPGPVGYARKQLEQDLIKAIQTTFERGGAVLLPIFAMGKTQEILTVLHHAQRRGELPDSTLFIGGLGKVFAQIYDRTAGRSERAFPNLQLLEDIRPQVFDLRKARDFKPQRGHIYLLPSGMMTLQTTSNVLAPAFLARENDSIFFVGYTDPASPAGHLRRTERGQRVTINPLLGDHPVRCEVKYFDFTSHALREDLLEFILEARPKNCALVHGDTAALEWFKQAVQERNPKINVFLPEPGKEIAF